MRLYFLFFCSNCIAVEVLPPPFLDDSELTDFKKWQEVAVNKQLLVGADKPQAYLNELVLSSSPYLTQHARNPINWKIWNEKIKQRAKSENKLIFLSIGYSTCHWCHVMEKESFVDLDVAKLVNKNFVAIKVDREELPHIDEYYASALAQVKGSAGWPITVITDSSGLPLFIDSYIPKSKLKKLLQRIPTIWRQNSDFLIASAKQIDNSVRARHQVVDASPNDKDFLSKINTKLLKQLDPGFGGFIGEVKFPNESLLLYLLDQLQRQKSKPLEKLLKLQLDSMLAGGLWDHVEGGFHRYSTDDTWTVPHFEKMLYNQAQLIIVYSRAYRYFNDSKYAEAVKRIVDFVLLSMYEEDKGFWSAIDADFNGIEGGYYLWTTQELSEVREKYYSTYTVPGTRQVAIKLNAKSDSISEAELESIRKSLLSQRKRKGIPHIDKKIITAWNAQMIQALVEAEQIFDSREYKKIAQKLAFKIWQERFLAGSGRLARLVNPKTQEHLFLEDYALFIRALISLYDITGQKHWLEKSNLLAESAATFFISEEQRLSNYYSSDTKLRLTKTQDGEIINSMAMFVYDLLLLDQRDGKKRLTSRYKKLVGALSSKVELEPLNHLFFSYVLNNLKYGQSSPKRYFAEGKGEVSYQCTNFINAVCRQLTINVKLKKGWHINSNKPIQDYLIATKVDARQEIKVTYPKGKIVKLGFQNEPLDVFEGEFSIELEKSESSNLVDYVTLPLQACSDVICLLPERQIIRF